MTKYESSIREIPYSQTAVFAMVSNLENLNRVKDHVPAEQLQGLRFDNDTIGVDAPMVGHLSMKIVDRDEPKCVKFESVESPLPFNFWIQVLPVTEQSSKMKLTLAAELNFFMRQMAEKPLKEMLEKIADALQNIQYQ